MGKTNDASDMVVSVSDRLTVASDYQLSKVQSKQALRKGTVGYWRSVVQEGSCHDYDSLFVSFACG